MQTETVKEKKLSLDMTEGDETRHIIRFTLPLLGGNLLQQTYNAADTLIVGRFLGEDALAAVGATGSVTYLFSTLCIGLSIGAGVIVSQMFGAGKLSRMKSAVFNSALVTALFGIVVSVIAVLLAEPALTLMGVPEKLLPHSVQYMKIACGGTIAVAAYNWINAIMRAMGDSKTPLIFLGIASFLNIALDLLFVVVLGFGISGAAWATVMTQALSAIGCISYCFKFNRDLAMSREEMTPDKDIMKKCIFTGVPIAAQNGLVSVSMVALQSVTNSFGETVMAAYTVSMRIEQFVQQPFSSLNAAVSTFTGQNIGAGKSERAVKGLKAAVKISSLLAIAVLILLIFFRKSVVGLFIDGESVIETASVAMLITALFYVPLGLIHTVRGFLNGAGDTGYALINGICEVVCRILFSLILTKISFIGCWGIWITTSLTWLFTAAAGIIRYKLGKWKNRSIA